MPDHADTGAYQGVYIYQVRSLVGAQSTARHAPCHAAMLSAAASLAKLLGWDSMGRLVACADEAHLHNAVESVLAAPHTSEMMPVLVIVEPDRLNSTVMGDDGCILYQPGPSFPCIITDPRQLYVFGAQDDGVPVVDMLFLQTHGQLAPKASFEQTHIGEYVYIENSNMNFFKAQVCMQLYSLSTPEGRRLCMKDKAGRWCDWNANSLVQRGQVTAALVVVVPSCGEIGQSMAWEEVHQLMLVDGGDQHCALFDDEDTTTTLHKNLEDFDEIFFE